MQNRNYKRPCYDHPLKDAIHAKGFTYDSFAEKCGIGRDVLLVIIGRKVKGIHHHAYTVESIACGLGVSVEEAERLIYGL